MTRTPRTGNHNLGCGENLRASKYSSGLLPCEHPECFRAHALPAWDEIINNRTQELRGRGDRVRPSSGADGVSTESGRASPAPDFAMGQLGSLCAKNNPIGKQLPHHHRHSNLLTRSCMAPWPSVGIRTAECPRSQPCATKDTQSEIDIGTHTHAYTQRQAHTHTQIDMR